MCFPVDSGILIQVHSKPLYLQTFFSENQAKFCQLERLYGPKFDLKYICFNLYIWPRKWFNISAHSLPKSSAYVKYELGLFGESMYALNTDIHSSGMTFTLELETWFKISRHSLLRRTLWLKYESGEIICEYAR